MLFICEHRPDLVLLLIAPGNSCSCFIGSSIMHDFQEKRSAYSCANRAYEANSYIPQKRVMLTNTIDGVISCSMVVQQ